MKLFFLFKIENINKKEKRFWATFHGIDGHLMDYSEKRFIIYHDHKKKQEFIVHKTISERKTQTTS